MRKFILSIRDDFDTLCREAEIDFLEEFIIEAMQIYRYRKQPIPQILTDTLPLVQKSVVALKTGTWEGGEADDLQQELDAFAIEFAAIDHMALADAILAVGVDVAKGYRDDRE